MKKLQDLQKANFADFQDMVKVRDPMNCMHYNILPCFINNFPFLARNIGVQPGSKQEHGDYDGEFET
jgi:hypothetical protein